MAWNGVGSGNLVAAVSDKIYFGQLSGSSLQCASGFVVQTVANVGGSAAAIVGQPELFMQVAVGLRAGGVSGGDYLIPLYRKS